MLARVDFRFAKIMQLLGSQSVENVRYAPIPGTQTALVAVQPENDVAGDVDVFHDDRLEGLQNTLGMGESGNVECAYTTVEDHKRLQREASVCRRTQRTLKPRLMTQRKNSDHPSREK